MRATGARSIHAAARRNVFPVLLVTLLVACSPSPEPVAQPAGPVPSVLPELQPVMVPALDTAGRVHAIAWIAVSTHGHIAFVDKSDSEKSAIVIIDTLGRRVRIANVGSGLKGPPSLSPLFFVGAEDDLLVPDLAVRRLERFGVDGKHKSTSATFEAGMPIGVTADSIDMAMFGDELIFESIVRLSLKTLESRVMVDRTDSTFASFRGPMASSNGAIVVGLSRPYLFQSYSREGRPLARWGRNLPPRFYTAADERHFYNIVFDGKGRLWALGLDTNAVQFADVFSDTTFLGRMPLPCEGMGFNPSFNGEWMAVTCAAAQGDKQMGLRLFRVLK